MKRAPLRRNRTERFELRLSPKDAEQFRALARTAGLSVAELVRRAVLGLKIIPKIESIAVSEMRRIAGLLKHLAMQGHETRAAINAVVDCVQRVTSKIADDSPPVTVNAAARFRDTRLGASG